MKLSKSSQSTGGDCGDNFGDFGDMTKFHDFLVKLHARSKYGSWVWSSWVVLDRLLVADELSE